MCLLVCILSIVVILSPKILGKPSYSMHMFEWVKEIYLV